MNKVFICLFRGLFFRMEYLDFVYLKDEDCQWVLIPPWSKECMRLHAMDIFGEGEVREQLTPEKFDEPTAHLHDHPPTHTNGGINLQLFT